MMIQLDPVIEVETPLGDGHAILVIDYGIHHNTCWVVALRPSGQIKHFDANDVQISENPAYGYSSSSAS